MANGKYHRNPVLVKNRVSEPYAKGLDVSQWQGNNFPFDRAADNGSSFAYIRASVRNKPDPFYLDHHTRAQDAGLLTGPYHYLYPTPDPKLQAATFVQTITSTTVLDLLPPALDVEELELTEIHVLKFISAWTQLTNNAPLAIYSSRRAWHNTVDRTAQWPLAHKLWIADWRGNDQPALPEPWADWTFWQYTSKGHVPGHKGRVDLNYYNGTAAHLRKNYAELWS